MLLIKGKGGRVNALQDIAIIKDMDSGTVSIYMYSAIARIRKRANCE